MRSRPRMVRRSRDTSLISFSMSCPEVALLDLAFDEVPSGGTGGLLVHGVDLVVPGVDGEASLDILVGVGRHRVVHHLNDGGAEGGRRQSSRIGFQQLL